jgi:hypothetical protein
MSTRINWIFGIALILFIVCLVIVTLYKQPDDRVSKWSWSPWQMAKNDTSTNILSYCTNGVYHCASDGITAISDTQFNSKSTFIYYSSDNGNSFQGDIFPIPNFRIGGITNDGSAIIGISQDLDVSMNDVSMNECKLWVINYIPYGGSIYDYFKNLPDTMHKPYATAMTSDGSCIYVAGNDNDTICYSTDSGETWANSNAPPGYWMHLVASRDISHDGHPLWMSAYYSGSSSNTLPDVYISSDGGMHWIPSSQQSTSDETSLQSLLSGTPSIPNTNISITNGNTKKSDGITSVNNSSSKMKFVSACISDSGQYHSAIINVALYISSDYGSNWTKINLISPDLVIHDWSSISCSADGKTQLICSNNEGVYESNDYGRTWVYQSQVQDATGMFSGAAPYDDTFYTLTVQFDTGQCVTTTELFYYKRYTGIGWLIAQILLIILICVSIGLYVYYRMYMSPSQPSTTASQPSTTASQPSTTSSQPSTTAM